MKMKLRKLGKSAMVWAVILYCLCIPAYAEENVSDGAIRQEDIMWEWIEMSEKESGESDIMPLSSASINQNILAHSIIKVSPLIYLQEGNKVSFDCTYSLSSASMSFGILSSDGKFYPINVQNGKIKQSIQVSFSGDYYIAIRNNSAQSVTVTGTVDY